MLERGTYGVEWTPRPKERDSSLVGWVVALVIVVALVSFSWRFYTRWRAKPDEPALLAERADSPPERLRAEPAAPKPEAKTVEPPPLPIGPTPQAEQLAARPVKVRNLLMRLEEAERTRDLEMAVSTIEQIRNLPGAPAADLDDHLARQLGALNVRRLFEKRNAQWVSTVTVGARQTASRIAAEHGSTFASLVRLNGKTDLNRVRVGQQLFVLNHPRFNLVVHRRMRTADLQLNGKFFKRYDLVSVAGLVDGAHEWRDVKPDLSVTDRQELDLLLPKSASVLVSDL